MANDRIVAWLRLRDLARFKRDAASAESSIKQLGDAGKDSQGPLNQLGGALGSLGEAISGMGGRTRIFGFALGTVVTALIAVIPLVVGLGGALVAVTGSLAGAALGAGALGTSLAALAIPLGAFGIVAMAAFQNFSKANTAFQQWQVQVAAYGANSKQAETALMRFQGILSTFGANGGVIEKAILAWDKFKRTFQEANAGTFNNIYTMMLKFFQIATKLTPTIAYLAQKVSGVMLLAFDKLGAVLTSPAIQQALRGFGDSFAQLGGPLTDAFINFLVGFINLATRAMPMFLGLAGGILGVSEAFKNWTTGSGVGTILTMFQSWWNLAKAIGGLLITIFSGGAKEGTSLVDSLTAIVNRWNEWLKGAEGSKSMAKFFADAAAMTRAFFSILIPVIGAIFKFGRALMPIYTVVFKALKQGWTDFMTALKPSAPYFNNIIFPLLKGIAVGVISGVVGAFKLLIFVLGIWAKMAGFVGSKLAFLKPIFFLMGQVIGFVFGGAILKALSLLGKLHFILGPIGSAFKLLSIPLRLAGGMVGWVASKLGGLFMWFGRIAYKAVPGFRGAIDKVLDFLTGAGSRFFDAGTKLWNALKNGISKAIGSGLGFAADLGKSVANAVIGFLNSAIPNSIPVPHAPDIDIPNNPIPQLASGGVVAGSGSWITGEAGPEINTLRNGKVQVVPLTPSVSTQAATATLAPGRGNISVAKVYLRGKQIAEAVADEADDARARR